jgi:outer membrane protein, heavy metal efflux system
MKRRYFVCSILIVTAVLNAAEPVDAVASTNPVVAVEQLVSEALRSNPELKFYEAEIAVARAGAKNAGRLSPPELDGTFGQKSVRESGNGPDGEGVAWSVALRQPIEWPGRLGLRKAIANRDIELAELGLAQFRATLAGKVRSTAHDLSVAQQRVAASQPVANRLRELRETLVARDPGGLTPLLETRVIEATEVKAAHVAAKAEHDREHLAIELNYLRGQAPTASLRVAEVPLHFGPVPELHKLYAAAATNNFDLRLRVAEFERQGFRIALARNERFPAFTVGPVISEERAGDRERIVGLSISAPLPLWQNNRAKVEVAEARRLQAEAELENARRQLERDVADYAHKYEHALGLLSKWRPDAIQHFQEAAELADRHYRLGAVSVSTYVELQRQYVEAVESLLDARKEALAAAQKLELFTGLPVSLVNTPKEVKP